MRIKIFEFNRYKQTLESFETSVREFLQDTPIVAMKIWENSYNSEIVFQFTVGSIPLPPQEFRLWGWMDLEIAEGIANTTLEAVSRAGKKAEHLSIVSLSRSNRAMLAMIVQAESGPHGIQAAEQADKKASAESHPSVDEVPDGGAKRRGGRRDRKTPS